jgi:hypothetical protein
MFYVGDKVTNKSKFEENEFMGEDCFLPGLEIGTVGTIIEIMYTDDFDPDENEYIVEFNNLPYEMVYGWELDPA